MTDLHWSAASGPDFTTRPAHRLWLLDQARGLFDFFGQNALDPAGGFFKLGTDGTPLANPLREIHETTRMVHCFAMAHQLGLPGAARMVDHGMDFLLNAHRDSQNGGYFWGVTAAGDRPNPTKQAYGHAFVLLAASSARVIGHPEADRLLTDITDILLTRFWDDAAGATTEEYNSDWSEIGPYRGQNSNMHLTEALMAAFEATADTRYLTMAERIADLIINRHARALDWRVGEHFTTGWQLDRAHAGDPMFRPAGHTPGHALEWARLLTQLWHLGGRRLDWAQEAAEVLFLHTCDIGWDARTGGFYYTMDWENHPDRADRYWWPCAEGIAAAAVIRASGGDARFEGWYRRIWDFVSAHVIDHRHGSWHPELDADMRPVGTVFTGKPDLYHAVQACLIPLVPPTGSATQGLAEGGVAIDL